MFWSAKEVRRLEDPAGLVEEIQRGRNRVGTVALKPDDPDDIRAIERRRIERENWWLCAEESEIIEKIKNLLLFVTSSSQKTR